jgi:hypothetical protein
MCRLDDLCRDVDGLAGFLARSRESGSDIADYVGRHGCLSAFSDRKFTRSPLRAEKSNIRKRRSGVNEEKLKIPQFSMPVAAVVFIRF